LQINLSHNHHSRFVVGLAEKHYQSMNNYVLQGSMPCCPLFLKYGVPLPNIQNIFPFCIRRTLQGYIWLKFICYKTLHNKHRFRCLSSKLYFC